MSRDRFAFPKISGMFLYGLCAAACTLTLACFWLCWLIDWWENRIGLIPMGPEA